MPGDSSEKFIVCARGEMHVSILIETMRREGFELLVSNPKVLYKTIDGEKCEPFEDVFIDVPENFLGPVMEKIGARKGELIEMKNKGSRVLLKFLVPSRGLFGYRNEFLTDTKGEGIISSIFRCYKPVKEGIKTRTTGSLVSHEEGTTTIYGLFNAQVRGQLFFPPNTEVYEGMVVGFCPKQSDIIVNVCKKKHLTNMRAAGSDDNMNLVPHTKFSLEQYIEFLAEDELLEVTPKSLRVRKYILNNQQRAKKKNEKR